MRSGLSRVARSRPVRPEVSDRRLMPGLLRRKRATNSTLAGLSSMYRTLRVAPAGACGLVASDDGAGPAAGAWTRSGARGRVTVNADPWPGTLVAVSWPPMASVRARASGSPMPVPSIAVCSAPRRSKATKIRSMLSGEMPGPVSETVMVAWLVPCARQVIVTVPPRWLYLMALEVRLTRTWDSRCRSAWTARP